MSLVPPPTVRKLQEALHAKAKRAPSYRFYALYDKLYRADVLSHAYFGCAANDGAAGVDDQTFADIEAYGIDRWRGEVVPPVEPRVVGLPHPFAGSATTFPVSRPARRSLALRPACSRSR